MAVKWTIDSENRMMHAVAEGDVTRREVDDLLDAMQAAGTLAYRKLFDAAKADIKMAPEDVMALGVRMRSTHVPGSSVGPLAIVVPADKEKLLERLFGMLAVPDRPMRVFNDSAQAHRWIQKQFAGD
jgi:hypothetical protein